MSNDYIYGSLPTNPPLTLLTILRFCSENYGLDRILCYLRWPDKRCSHRKEVPQSLVEGDAGRDGI